MSVIVVIDDRTTNRRILSQLSVSLEETTLVKDFENPVKALAWIEDNTPDLVVTDFKMPEMDGAEFVRRFRELPLCFDVPVIVVTAFQDRAFRYRALGAGATDFLLSPIDHREFRVRAHNLLTLHEHQKINQQRAAELEQKLRSSGDEHEEEMRRGRERLLGVIDALPAMISATDEEGRYVFVNRYLASSLGIEPDSAVGKTAIELFSADTAEEHHKRDREIFNTGESGPAYEEEFIDRGGVKRVLLTTKRPLRDSSGGTANVVTVSLDISTRKEAEETLRNAKEEADAANKSKTDFLANMSHELRTPLNAILGYAEVIQRQIIGPVGTEKYIEYAENIGTSGHYLLSIIDDILEVSKIEAGMIELREDVFDIAGTVNDVVRIICGRAKEAGIKLEIGTLEDLPYLKADERKLKQILLNLLSNAVKFTGKGGRVDITARELPDGGLEFRVTDNGIGMAQEDIPRAMERFGQIGDVLTRQHAGTGLGLPLSASLVELHGGKLELTSERGNGTTVTLRFPPERCFAQPDEAGVEFEQQVV